MQAAENPTAEEFLSEFTALFLEDSRQKVELLESLVIDLEHIGKCGERYFDFMRTVHSLKGTAPTFGFPTVGMIAHRLEDYMNNISALTGQSTHDVYVYIDAIGRILDDGHNPESGVEALILRALPSAVNFGNFSLEHKPIKALFIGPKNVQFTIVEHELKSCGFSVTNSQNSFQAVEMALRMRPDLIMVCNVIDILNGIEVAHIIRSINATRNIPMVFVTSDVAEDPGQSALKSKLPKEVEIVRKSHFPDDFADAIIQLEIM
ncbi:MAG TPA: Hpt domain-containing protein [Azospirillaceae bacterium]|nr:Hpt domain-containing protein [Azospirillaceae bacterium]